MYPEEKTAGFATRSLRETVGVDARASDLQEIFEQVASNSRRVSMSAQRIKDFLQRNKGNFPMQENGCEKVPSRLGRVGEIYDVTRQEADMLSEIEQLLNYLEEIG